jgi:hypothetical protein
LIAGTLAAIYLLPAAPVIGSVPTGLPDFHLPAITLGQLPTIVQPALILALLGSIDSLLTSLVADSITRTRHNSNRELIGQGMGNMIAGLIGGLPGAGATMRTVVNVRAGGSTPVSGALHAAILLALVLGLGPIAEQIPHAALAGNFDESRLGHHRLGLSETFSPRAARQAARDAGDSRLNRICRSDHGRRRRVDSGGFCDRAMDGKGGT